MDYENQMHKEAAPNNVSTPYVQFTDDSSESKKPAEPSFLHDLVLILHLLVRPFAALFELLGSLANAMGICMLKCRCRCAWFVIYFLALLLLLIWLPIFLVLCLVAFLLTALQCRCLARKYDNEPLPEDSIVFQTNLMLPYGVMVDVAELLGM